MNVGWVALLAEIGFGCRGRLARQFSTSLRFILDTALQKSLCQFGRRFMQLQTAGWRYSTARGSAAC